MVGVRAGGVLIATGVGDGIATRLPVAAVVVVVVVFDGAAVVCVVVADVGEGSYKRGENFKC